MITRFCVIDGDDANLKRYLWSSVDNAADRPGPVSGLAVLPHRDTWLPRSRHAS
jgi:hypothetical protein